jgi:hypothetical protein
MRTFGYMETLDPTPIVSRLAIYRSVTFLHSPALCFEKRELGQLRHRLHGLIRPNSHRKQTDTP